MDGTFNKLFMYNVVSESGGKIHFDGITLLKMFPDPNFIAGDRYVCACVDPIEGTVFLYNDIDDLSKLVKIKEWMDSPGLSRTDTSSYRFSIFGRF